MAQPRRSYIYDWRFLVPPPPPAATLSPPNLPTNAISTGSLGLRRDDPEPATRPRIRAIRELLVVFGAMLGVRGDRPRGERIISALGVLTTVGLGFFLTGTPLPALWGAVDTRPAFGPAAVYLGLVGAIYYLGHPLFYVLNGHRWLRRAIGRERAYAVYSTTLGVVFGNLVFGVVPFFTATSAASGAGQGAVSDLLWLGAILLGVSSTCIKAWATLCLGVDGYYYRDMFQEQPSGGEPICHGPYRYFSDPMYSVGYFAIYAGALYAQSAPGLLVALGFHICIFLFNGLVERPIFAAIYGGQEAAATPAAPAGTVVTPVTPDTSASVATGQVSGSAR